MKVLETEKKIGIDTYFTNFEGIGGKLRFLPEDFVVGEVSNYPPKKEDGKFTIADVTATNWETNILVRDISNWLHISRQRIGFAGTKDRRAKTTRLMSFYKVPINDLSTVDLKDVKIENIYSSDRPIKIGNLIGNRFETTIRNIDKKIKISYIEDSSKFLEEFGGFPNFYGIQRFGIVRPITHIVGKYIVKDDFEKAVMSYIANPIKGEDEESYNLRKQLETTRDYPEALKSYPKKLNYEKSMLNKLVVHPNDFVGALKELPNNLLTMFVYAYQSYLFNKILSERIKKKLPITKAILGDIVLPIRRGILEQEYISVKENNIDKINKQISKNKAVVSGVLFGTDSVFCDGEMGEIEHKTIEKEKFDPRDFIIPDIPFISSTGSRHPLFSPVKDFDYKLFDDKLNENKNALILKFQLQKGSYATSLLREFMKSNDIRNY